MTTALMPEGFTPFNAFEMHFGVQVPDPLTFVVGPTWLNSPQIYPRQGTVMKVIFARLDLLTEYDHKVLDEWEERFRITGDEGIVPGVRDRMRYLNLHGAPWFREVMFAMGRRAGKGHLAARAQAYVIWNYLAKGDPQGFFGVDRGKKLACLIFAGKRDQAKATVFGDIVNVVTNSECFAPYINDTMTEKLSIYAPHDFIRMKRMAERGISAKRDMATFEIMPKESTPMAGRGPTSFSLAFDEMAHITASGTARSADEVYHCLDPKTRVLTADMRWVRLEDVQVGDRLVGVDEEVPGPKQHRKLQETEVLGVSRTQNRRAYRITFDDGSHVTCSGNHRWLRSAGGNNYRWASIEKLSAAEGGTGNNRWPQLKVGQWIKNLVNPWEPDESFDGGYLSGVYDGEGHVRWDGRNSCLLGFSQKPGEVCDRVKDLLEERGYNYIFFPSEGHATRVTDELVVRGAEEVMRFLGEMRPLRLARNFDKLWRGRSFKGGSKQIVSIEEVEQQDLIDLETSTHTFIAEGLVSHNSAKPSTDQFKDWAFLVEPSSPWQRMGQFYDNCNEAIGLDDRGVPLRPNWLLIQLPSWEIYKDWERASEIPMFPDEFVGDLGEYEGVEKPHYPAMRGAIQTYDDEMRREERSNPETFAVERKAKWANVLDAYLREEMVDGVFAPWEDRPEAYGPPEITTKRAGIMQLSYLVHGDPAKVNDTFGYAIAHAEIDAEGRHHCVFDMVGSFDPADYPDHILDYDEIEEWFWHEAILAFHPDQVTFDQFNSTGFIQRLNKRIRGRSLPKRTVVVETPVNRAGDWEEKESAKAAIYNGLVHAPHNEQLRDELKYLQLVNGRVDHPSAGPVQSKDVADCFTHLIHALIGEQTAAMIRGDLASFVPRGMGQPMPFAQQMGGDGDQSFLSNASAEDRAKIGALRGFSGGSNPFAENGARFGGRRRPGGTPRW